MRVVQLGPFPPPHGGVETNLVAIRNYLRARGIACSVINITRHRKPETDGVFYPRNAPELLWDLLTKSGDVRHLHVGGGIPRRVKLLMLAAALVPSAKSVFTLHSGGFPSSAEGKAASAKSLLGFALRRFSRLIAVNREIEDFYVRMGVPHSKIHLILPHSVSLAEVADALPEPLASFFAEHDPMLIAVCGLEPEYDLPTQITAMETVLRNHPKAGLLIAGKGSLESQLRAEIARKPYAENILLLGDVPHDVTLRGIVESDILLRTTLYDGDAISVREALYLGTPVIATDNGMRPEGVDLIPVQDPVALADAIERRLKAGPASTPKGENDESNLAAVLDLYYDALGSSHAR